MEFAKVGKHCELPGCNQQDYMPFECVYCKKIHCGKHRRPDDHQCAVGGDQDSIYVIICPICDDRIRLEKGKDADTCWNEHSSSGICAIEEKKKQQRELEEASQAKKCQVDKCNSKLTATNRYQCGECLMELCLKHRFNDMHDCRKLVTSDKRLQKSKLLQLGQKSYQPQVPTNQPVYSASELREQEYQMSSFQNVMPNPTSSGYNPVVEEQQRLLSQFQFGGSLPTSNANQATQGTGPEKCPICDARFSDVMDLINHTESVHRAKEQQLPEKRVESDKCHVCKKRFAISELPTHMQQEHFIF